MSKYKWLLDAGHGGLTPDGKYTTAPGKMYTFPNGLVFEEGVSNRAIVNRIVEWLRVAEIDFALMHDEVRDTPLQERVARANKLWATDKRCIYLSIHSDAMPEGAHGKGSGFAVFTSPGKTASDTIADCFCEMLEMELPEFRLRKDLSDGDADREENFYVLRETKCPAVLVENLFYDNQREAEFLLSEAGRNKVADTLYMAIAYMEEFSSPHP
jgi:N-acetylmuramoyl-L-alanine amidase